jgi:hypothetical protein
LIAGRLLLYGVLAVSALLTVRGPLAAAETPRASRYGSLLRQHQHDDQYAVRIQEDVARRRLWVLSLQHVYVYDTEKLELIRRIRLPGWSVADVDFMCPPDMVLDQRGTAFVSNNVEPRLLQIDPVTFQEKEHQLRLISKKRWDIGFGGLAFGSDGTLFALSALAGSVFRIDLASRSAREIALTKPVLAGCVLTYLDQNHPRAQPGVVSLCIRSGNSSRRVDISSDLARGLVTNESC